MERQPGPNAVGSEGLQGAPSHRARVPKELSSTGLGPLRGWAARFPCHTGEIISPLAAWWFICLLPVTIYMLTF